MKELKPLPCSTFLQVLLLLDAYVGPDIDGVATIYAWKGSGYYPVPKGPQFAFKTRAEDEMVTALEIEAGLGHLRYSVAAFIEMTERLTLPPPKAVVPAAPKIPNRQ